MTDNAPSTTSSTDLVPQDWISELQLSVYAPPKVLTKEALESGFETYNEWAGVGFRARNRLEAFSYLTIFSIHKHKLWKARFETWEEYCNAVELQAFAPGKRTIKEKVATIGALVGAGVEFDKLVGALANRPVATQELASTPIEQLPEPIAAVIERWDDMDMSAGQARNDLEELTGKPKIWCSLAEYYKDTKVLALTIVVKPQDDDSTEVYHRIEGVSFELAEWYAKKFNTRLAFRETVKTKESKVKAKPAPSSSRASMPKAKPNLTKKAGKK